MSWASIPVFFRKPIKLPQDVYTDVNFFHAYKWDCMEWNKPTVPPSALVLSHLSSHPRDKLIVTNWYFYTPFRILRRIFSVRTREQSFHSRVLTVQPWYIIYDTVVRNDWRPWIAIYDTTKSATRKRENFFPLPPSLLLFYVKPNSNVQDSVGYPRVSVRDDDVANLLRIPQMRKTSGYTYTRSI